VKTTVGNIRTEPFPTNGVYIGRAGKGHDGFFGNPYVLGPNNPRGSTIERYKSYFYSRMREPEFRARVMQLAGKRLMCFCKPHACHGDVIAEFLNGTVV
jgi:hypothetical protein